MKNSSSILSLLLISFCFTFIQGQDYNRALQYAYAGQHEQAEAVFELLDSKGGLTQQQIKDRAYNYSWWGRHNQALELFNQLLENEQSISEVYIGIAHTYRNLKQYAKAVQFYNLALKEDPANAEAQKGMAFAYLENGKPDGALYIASIQEEEGKTDSEWYYIAGLAYLKKMKLEEAKKSFQSSIAIDPNNQAAKFHLSHLVSQPSSWIVTPWYGISKSGNTTSNGLRRLDVSFHLPAGSVYYATLDNSLQLENIFLVQNNLSSNWFSMGHLRQWNARTSTNLRIGYNQIDQVADRYNLRWEQNIFFADRFRFMGGIQYDFSKQAEFRSFSAIIDSKISNFYSLEIQSHVTNSLISGLAEKQVVAVHKFTPGYQLEFITGMVYRNIDVTEISNKNYYGAYLMTTFPIIKKFQGKILTSFQEDISVNLWSFALGISTRI